MRMHRTTADTTKELATWIAQHLPVEELTIPGVGMVSEWGGIVETVLRIVSAYVSSQRSSVHHSKLVNVTC
jgi:hypothetical protein